MTHINGLRSEITDGVNLNARSIAILYELEKNGAVWFQTDDSMDDLTTKGNLQIICGEVGYVFLSFGNCHYLIDENKIEER